MESNTRREQRYPFIASAEVFEEHSGSRMSSRISDFEFSGCYVDAISPLPDGTTVQLKIFTETHTFEAPATVVYSHTHLGTGMKFREGQVLRLWLRQTTAHANQAGIKRNAFARIL